MNDFFQALRDAFPVLKSHPVATARILLALLIIVWFYSAQKWRKRFFGSLCSEMYDKVACRQRWLRVYQDAQLVNDWKYYTSEVTGKGDLGDDVIWTLVSWPRFKPIDSFRVVGGVGMVDGIHESQVKLEGRWQIIHDPDQPSIGPIPAHGMRSTLRRTCARVLLFLASF